MAKLRYHWRFRPVSPGEESREEGELNDSPLELLRVGPYEVQCAKVSITARSDARGRAVIDWTVRVTFLPEEVTVMAVPQASAAALDLATASDAAPGSADRPKSQ